MKPNRTLLLLVGVFLLVALPTAAQAPAPRHGHRLVYDAAREAVVMFGGRTHDRRYLNDTWSWNGTTWTRVNELGPDPRAWFALAYDSARDVVVLFGGRDASGSSLGDTWEWDGAEWTLVDEPGPEPRDHHAMAYDPSNRRVVMFGGYNGSVSFADTWSWDGSTWTRLSSDGPSKRDAHQLVLDRARDEVILFGGMYLEDDDAIVLSDTWAWNGGWSELDEGSENGRSHFAAAFEPMCECLVRFGGGDPERVPRGGTWRFVGGAWNDLDVEGPSARVDHDMVLDIARNKIVMFGGYIPTPGGEIFGDIWEWSGTAWEQR